MIAGRTLAIAGAALVALLIAAVVAVVLIVSGGDDESQQAPAPGAVFGAPAVSGAPQELQDCLSEHGVVPPDEPPEPGAAPDQDQLDAMEDCARYLPEGGPGAGGAPPAFEIPAG